MWFCCSLFIRARKVVICLELISRSGIGASRASTTTAVLPTNYIAMLYLDLGFLSGPTACGFQIRSLSSPSERTSVGSVNIWYSHHMVFVIIHPELNISKTWHFFSPFSTFWEGVVVLIIWGLFKFKLPNIKINEVRGDAGFSICLSTT